MPSIDLLAATQNETHGLSPTKICLSVLATKIREKFLPLVYKPGVHTPGYLRAAGFYYTGTGDAARCEQCGLEISNWTSDMNPFTIHSRAKPNCPFNFSLRGISALPITNEQENPYVPLSIETNESKSLSNTLSETDLLQQARRRTFSHWPHHTTPSSAHMVDAGFFNCNVGDRVICIYCNLICQHWTPYVDNPCEVHKTLSPRCVYVKTSLTRHEVAQIINNNGILTRPTTSSSSSVSNNAVSLTVSPFVRPLVQRNTIFNNLPGPPPIDDLIGADYFNTDVKNNINCTFCKGAFRNWGSSENPMDDHAERFPDCPYVQQLRGTGMYRHIPQSDQIQQERTELSKRLGTFRTWSNTNSPSVEDLAHAGFFYTGTKDIVTCFYCNESLHNWRSNDNPMTEHARWFPHCAYVKRMREAEINRRIRESERKQQEHVGTEKSSKNTDTSSCSGPLLIPDESTLSRLVAARLDLPISQTLLKRNFKLSIIKRCWEDQLRHKEEDFVHGLDLELACLILQKQIEYIDDKKENIIIPTKAMKGFKERAEREQLEILAQRRAATLPHLNTDVPLSPTGDADNAHPANLCDLCVTEEKCLACIPCGHLATCVPCGHSLRSCPVCRAAIQGFVRIYL